MFAIKQIVVSTLKTCRKSIGWSSSSCFSTFTSPLFVRVTPMLMAEPMKKRKKADASITKVREEKKRKRLWRDIKRLMKNQNQLKPLDELEIPYSLVDEPQKYAREKVTLSDDEVFEREELLQKWSIYRMKRHTRDLQIIERIEMAQQNALDELYLASPRLYDEAIKVDDTFLPFTIDGPTITPPIKDYDVPQGDYKDCTRTWEPPVIPEMDKKLKKQRLEARKTLDLEKDKS